MTVYGKNFQRTGRGALVFRGPTWKAFFGLFVANYTYVSSTRLRVQVPMGATVSAKIALKEYGRIITQTGTNFVIPPPPPTLTITNNAQYDIVSLRINGQEFLQYPDVLPIGATTELTGDAGTVDVELGIGNWGLYGGRDVWFWRSTYTSIQPGPSTDVTFDAISIAELMTN